MVIVGSQEVEMWFYTYQRLLVTSHPHSRPPVVCVCVSALGKPSIDTQLSTVLIQSLYRGSPCITRASTTK